MLRQGSFICFGCGPFLYNLMNIPRCGCSTRVAVSQFNIVIAYFKMVSKNLRPCFLSNENRRLKNFHRILNNQPLHPQLCNSRPFQRILPSPHSKRTTFQDITFAPNVSTVSTHLMRTHGHSAGHARHAVTVYCSVFVAYMK
jgi:hypothetical protein